MRNHIWALILFLVLGMGAVMLADRRWFFEASWHVNRALVYVRTWYLPELVSPHFVIRYPHGAEGDARLVAAAAEHFYSLVNRDFSGEIPEKNIIVLVNQFSDNSTMALYHRGVIEVLAPSRWLPPVEEKERLFYTEGPMAHELTHLAVDRVTRGNVPRWLTEGVAQYEEYKLVGRVPGSSDLPLRGPALPVPEAAFDLVEDQEEAYDEALNWVLWVTEHFGEEYLYQIMAKLADGARPQELVPSDALRWASQGAGSV